MTNSFYPLNKMDLKNIKKIIPNLHCTYSIFWTWKAKNTWFLYKFNYTIIWKYLKYIQCTILILPILTSGRRSASSSKRPAGSSSLLNVASGSDSGTSRGAKPHTSSSLMSGQEGADNPDNGGRARPRPTEEGGSQPSLAGMSEPSYKLM